VIYEWLCGERPFDGSMTEVMVKHLSMPPPSLRERVPTLPGEIERIVLQALDKDPKHRFASVQDFALALEKASREETSGQTLVVLTAGEPAVAAQRAASVLHSPRGTVTPVKTLDNSSNNLPIQPTPLIGRLQEVGAVCSLMRHNDVRLVTLTGPGGIGKRGSATWPNVCESVARPGACLFLASSRGRSWRKFVFSQAH
jgi:serine/threonine protein kinase